MTIGVNTAASNAQRVKVGDFGSLISINLMNVEEEEVAALEWVRVTDKKSPIKQNYIDVPDFTVEKGVAFITLPEIERGEYTIEMKDDKGRIYPAEGALDLIMIPSTKDAVEVYYTSYRELIVEDVTPVIQDYLISNPDDFKGEQGDRGPAFVFGDFTESELGRLKDQIIESVLPEIEGIINPPIDDPYNTPGPRHLVAGNRQAGFFGFVEPHELEAGFDGDALALAVGISIGTVMESKTPWMKFAWKGKIQFIPLKSIRHTTSWDDLYNAGAVYGTGSTISDGEAHMLATDANYADKERVPQDAMIRLGEFNFKVRLMRGSAEDPNTYSESDRGSNGPDNEWNALILPLHEQAPDNFTYNAFADTPRPDWGVDLTDEDLRAHHTHGVGSYQWMQEYSDLLVEADNGIQRRRVSRGYIGASYLSARYSAARGSSYAWRPVLELH